MQNTISSSSNDITNLELYTYEDLEKIKSVLRINYQPQQIYNSSHLFELVEISKTHVVVTDNTMIVILKFPILKNSCQLSRIIPSTNHHILLPPKIFFCNGPMNATPIQKIVSIC